MDVFSTVASAIDLAEKVHKVIDDYHKAPERLRLLQQDIRSIQDVLQGLKTLDQSVRPLGIGVETDIAETEELLERILGDVLKLRSRKSDSVFSRPFRSLRMQRGVNELAEWSTELQKKKMSLSLSISKVNLSLVVNIEGNMQSSKKGLRANRGVGNQGDNNPSHMTLDEFMDSLQVPNYIDDRLRIKEASEGTAGWIYSSQEYRDWLDSPNRVASLHIVGKMGSGKSVLMKSIISKGLGTSSLESSDKRDIVLYYFCTCVNRTETATSILKGLIAQLLSECPGLFEEAIGDMEVLRVKRSSASSSWSFESLRHIFLTLLPRATVSNLYVVVDALDECEPAGLDDVLELLIGLEKTLPSPGFNIRMLFSSREYPRILAAFDGGESCHRIFVRPQTVASDIRVAMRDDLLKVRRLLDLDEEEGERLQEALLDKSDGMFLWVSLAIKEIMANCYATTKEDLEALIHDLPVGLRGLYEKGWAKTIQLLPPEQVSLARRVLLWLLLAKRPLTIPELTVAMAVKPSDHQVPPEKKLLRSLSRFILTYLNPFVEISEVGLDSRPDDADKESAKAFEPVGPKVRLVHQSAQEYLLEVCEKRASHVGTPGLDIDLQSGHEEIARVCISYLRCDELQMGWVDRENRGPTGLQITTDETRKEIRRRLETYPLLAYAARCWGYHVRLCQYSSLGQKDPPRCSGEQQEDIFQYTLDFLGRYPLGLECATQVDRLMKYWDDETVYGPAPVFPTVVMEDISLLVRRLLDDPKIDPFVQDDCGEFPLHFATTVDFPSDHPEERCEIIEMLLDAGADINCVGTPKDTPLHGAARLGLVEVVQLLLAKGADPSLLNANDYSPLNQVDALKCRPVVEALLCTGADPNSPDDRGYPPILNATNCHSWEVVRLLKDAGADLGIVAPDGWSCLHHAAQNADIDLITLILESNPSVIEQKSDKGWTPLHLMCWYDRHEVLQRLISLGVNLQAKTEDGFDPLHLAAQNGATNVLKLLLQEKTPVNIRGGTDECTPLHLTAEGGHKDATLVLLASGADIEAQLVHPCSRPLHLAVLHGKYDCIKVLLDHGADIHAVEEYGQTPLLIASREGHLDVVRLLVDRGANIDFLDAARNHAALHYAALSGNTEIVEYLIRQGATLELPGFKGLTPLQTAAAGHGQLETSKLLYQHGARFENGQIPYPNFGVACYNGHTEVVRWMLEIGIDTKGMTIDTMMYDCDERDGHPAITDILIDHGIDPNERGLEPEPPIFACVYRDRLDILEVLLKRGADINARGLAGTTAYAEALSKNKMEIANFLRQHGADPDLVLEELKNGATD